MSDEQVQTDLEWAAGHLRRAGELRLQAAQALERGDLEAAVDLEREARLEDRQFEALRRRGRRVPSSGQLTARTEAVTALSEMGVPAPPREIAAYHEARFGQPLDVRALASIRRDERKAFDRHQRSGQPGHHATGQAVYLVPALETRFYRPVHGPLTLSSWPLEKRLIAPTSARADHLRLTETIATVAQTQSQDAAVRLGDLAARYARHIPGASDPGAAVDLGRIVATCQSELALIGDRDSEARRAAAERAAAQLDPVEQLWGSGLQNGLAAVDSSGRKVRA
jgi:hypothetical protein